MTDPTRDDRPVDPNPARPERRLRVAPPGPAVRAPLDMGDPRTPPGGIQLTSRYVERDGRPWFPVMGEYHFSRDRPERWEQELQKMRSGGLNVVATYLIWILHEEQRGDLRWDGHRDLRRFVETAHRAGLEVVVRVGPWAHGETRNGGFPDWLQSLPLRHRTDDPDYLELTRGWFTAIAEQLRGLLRTEANPDGPVVGIQVDNELYDQPDHLRTLRRLAEEAGLRAPLWVATGWGGAQLPDEVLLPVYAGYSDGFWESSTTGWPEFGAMHFTFNTVRDDLSVGADLRAAPAEAVDASSGAEDPWPFVTCELGGGMQVAYHRRPLVDPDDVAALALTKLGSGSAWQGYYLYHGGTQVLGELSSTQESQETGYPSDLPVRNYDFYAPVGAEGGQRQHFHQLRRQHLFLDAFGPLLAACPTTLPDAPAGDVRWAVRGDGERGYLFFNNHQPAVAALPEVLGVQFHVDLGDRAMTVPATACTLVAGAFGAWPLRQRFGTVAALTVTAQPITQLDGPRGPVVLFAASTGVEVELQLEDTDPGTVSGATVRPVGDLLLATPDVAPGLGCEVRVGDTTLVFLDPATADALWRGDVGGRDSLVVWSGEGWFDGGFRLVRPLDDQRIAVYPALGETDLVREPGEGTLFTGYRVPGTAVLTEIEAPIFDVAAVAPVRTGGPADRLSAPTDADYAALAPVPVPVPDGLFEDAERLLLRLDWTGDAIRVYAGPLLIADQFWYGRELDVDLLPHRELIRTGGLWLRAFAWAPDSPVYVDPRVRPDIVEPVLQVRRATVHPVRTLRVG